MNIAKYAVMIKKFRANYFESASKNPEKIQRELLLDIIRKNQNSIYGKENDFRNIKSVFDFQSKVPLNNYETLRPYIERIMNGEQEVLTSDKVIFFAITSGTMGKSKYIPVTKYSRAEHKRFMDLWSYFGLRDHPKVLNGKILSIVSPEIDGYTPAHIPYGSVSGHSYKNIPFLIRNLYVLPYAVFEIKDFDAKYYCILRLAIEQNVSLLVTMNPSTILLLCQRIDVLKDRIIKDIREGSLWGELKISPEIRKKIEQKLHPNVKRAAELETLSKQNGGKLIPYKIWPELELIFCWKGGSVGGYLSHLYEYFRKNTAIRDFGYFSSEALASFPIDDAGCSGALAITTHFYEFIPRDEFESENRRFLFSHQLISGQEYFIILTTPGGLYRYHIDDIVKVTGFFNNTPLIEFRQKGSLVSSITGEKLYEMQVNEAIQNASNQTGTALQFFLAYVEWKEIPRYAFLAEFVKKDIDLNQKVKLLINIEKELNNINIEYFSKRNSQRLGPPVLKVLSSGSFERYRIKRNDQGIHDGQFKVPKLTRDNDFYKNFEIIEEVEI